MGRVTGSFLDEDSIPLGMDRGVWGVCKGPEGVDKSEKEDGTDGVGTLADVVCRCVDGAGEGGGVVCGCSEGSVERIGFFGDGVVATV